MTTFVGLLLLPVVASAKDVDVGVEQMIKLFQSACVTPFGDIVATRAWLVQHHLAPIKKEQATSVLGSRRGIIYAGSIGTDRYIVTTLDGGGCEITGRVEGSQLIPALENALKNMKLKVIRDDDHVDPARPDVHHYGYMVSRGSALSEMRVVTGIVSGKATALIKFRRRLPEEISPMPKPLPKAQ